MKSEESAAIAPLNDEEVRALELRWYQGLMIPTATRLVDFVRRHRGEILAGSDAPREPGSLIAATKRFILDRGSLHMESEINDQIREIQNELWYCGERGDHDSKRIKREWAANHAPAWRRWRINEYLFVADKCGEEIAKALSPELTTEQQSNKG